MSCVVFEKHFSILSHIVSVFKDSVATRDMDQGLGTRDQGLGIRDQGPKTKDQEPGTRDSGPGARDHWTTVLSH